MGALPALGDYQKRFCFERISWSTESERDPGKLLGPEDNLFRPNAFVPSTIVA